MTEKTERLSVELNDAFERLEQAQELPESGAAMSQEKSQKKSEGKSQEQFEAQKRDGKIQQSNSSGTGGIVGVLTGLIAIGIASYAAFNTYQLKTLEPVEMVSSAEVDQKIAALRQELEQTRQSSADAQSGISNRLDEFSRSQQLSAQQFEQQLKDRLDQSLSDVQKDIGTSSEDWLLAEAEYLIRLGSQRVMMEGDAQGAVALFESADVIIRDAVGISAFDLRQALAKDIAALKSVSDLDVDGIFVQLAALVDQVEGLKQHELKFVTEDLRVQVSDTEGLWGRLVALVSSGLERLGRLVDYRAEGSVVTPILPLKEEYYLRQNLVMQLQIAQLGLLRANQQIFSSSLNETQEWIVRYFDPEHPATVAMIASVSKLKELSVSRQMPDVSKSSREVRRLLARFHEKNSRRTVPVESEAPETSAPETNAPKTRAPVIEPLGIE